MRFRLYYRGAVALALLVLLPCLAPGAGAVPADWVRGDQGLTLTSSSAWAPELLAFDHRVYVVSDGTLFVQLYNTPCFGWRQVTVPAGSEYFKPVGEYLYAIGSNLWWIGTGDDITLPTWTEVSSIGLPAGAVPRLQAIFNAHLYATVSNTSGTFDVYRTPDIGKASMTWTKVVAAGFGDPLNHELGTLIEYNNHLVAVTTNTRTDPMQSFGDQRYYGTGIEVWESLSGDMDSWSQVNEDGFGTEETVPDPSDPADPTATMVVRTNQDFGSAMVYGGHLYIGTLAHWHSGEVWRYDGSGWINVTPDGMCAGMIMIGCGGPSRARDMVVYNGLLYLAEGVSTGNLETFDGATWTIVVGSETTDPIMGHPFDPANRGIASLAVLPSRPTLEGSTGDKLFALTTTSSGGGQVWSYPFSQALPTCEALELATITITPQSATSELFEGATHTVTVEVDAGSSFDLGEVLVSYSFCETQYYGEGGSTGCAMGWVEPDGLMTHTYTALYVEPTGLQTDDIEACFWTGDHSVCDYAEHTWADTIAPTITITTPQDGGKYMLNETVIADYSIQDAVGVQTTTAPVPDGGPIVTNVSGLQTFVVTATDYENNTTTESVTYTVQTPVEGTQDLASQVIDAQLPQDIEEGLTDKLDAAIKALNKGKKKTAINILNAFIKMVNAQRGKSITNEQAEVLIKAAQRILDSINAS